MQLFTRFALAGLASLTFGAAHAQTDLLADLEKQTADTARREVVTATFKGTRIVNAHSVETAGNGTLIFLIQHRFGALNSGAYEFFGLDGAALRLGFEYGFSNRLTLGVGRSSTGKTFDGFAKYRALQQSTGARAMPVSLTLLVGTAITTVKFGMAPVGGERSTASRVSYTYQALLARKFSPGFSAQLMPTLIHRNFVEQPTGQNDVYALGAGLRQKLSKRLALTADYFYLLPGNTADTYRNALGLGLDIETGGHVFQLLFSNTQAMIEPQFVPQTTGQFFSGDVYFGFTVARNFTVKSGL